MAEKAKPRGGGRKTGANGKQKPTGTPDRKARQRAAARAGHNSGEVPDEIYLRYLPKIRAAALAMHKAKEVFDQRKGELRQIYGAAKDDGCNIDAIRRARDLDEQDLATVAMDYAD